MKEQIQQMPSHQREEFLNNHAYHIEEGLYFRDFSPDELTQNHEAFTSKSIEIQEAEDQFAKIKDEWKAKLKVLTDHRKQILINLMQKGEYVNGKQYLLDDQVEGTMTYFDKEGSIIKTRRLAPNERQLSITSKTQA